MQRRNIYNDRNYDNRINYKNESYDNRYSNKLPICRDWMEGYCSHVNCKFIHPQTHPYYIYASSNFDIHPDELRLGVIQNPSLEQEADHIWVENYIQLCKENKDVIGFEFPSYKAFCIPFNPRKVYKEIEGFQNNARSINNYNINKRSGDGFRNTRYNYNNYNGNYNKYNNKNQYYQRYENNNYLYKHNNYNNKYNKDSKYNNLNNNVTFQQYSPVLSLNSNINMNDSPEYEEYKVPFE